MAIFGALLTLGIVLLLVSPSCAHELCVDGTGPRPQSITFCAAGPNQAYAVRGCCTRAADAAIQQQWSALTLGLTDAKDPKGCRTLLKGLMCARCDPWSAHLFEAERPGSSPRRVPWLCRRPSLSHPRTPNLCHTVFDACRAVRFSGGLPNPFTGARNATLAAAKKNLGRFSKAFCNPPQEYCFAGEPYAPVIPVIPPVEPNGPVFCFDRISPNFYLGMAALPLGPFGEGQGRALMWTQTGRVDLVRINPSGALTVLGVFLDLTQRVLANGEQGLLGLALHPRFATTGRLFVSYICDASVHPDCQGPCECRPERGCDGSIYGLQPTVCPFNTIVSEYRATTASWNASTAAPTEVRVLLKFGRPFANHNGGQILFNPSEPTNLYYMSGDGGAGGDPFRMAQNPQSFLGKILRIDVDAVPSIGRTYGIPADNPFVSTPGVAPEIYTLGMRNPWRCAFDSMTGAFLCADVGQNAYEEVDLILKGRNYGWSAYEGFTPYNAQNTSVGVITFPLYGYDHSENSDSSITGGVVYRSPLRNACFWGQYLFNDYAYGPWFVGTVYPGANQPYSAKRVAAKCWAGSSLPCPGGPNQTALISLSVAWGEDQAKDAYMFAAEGVFRLLDSSQCGTPCQGTRA